MDEKLNICIDYEFLKIPETKKSIKHYSGIEDSAVEYYESKGYYVFCTQRNWRYIDDNKETLQKLYKYFPDTININLEESGIPDMICFNKKECWFIEVKRGRVEHINDIESLRFTQVRWFNNNPKLNKKIIFITYID